MYAEGGIGIVSSTEQKSVIAVKANSNREEVSVRDREFQEEWRNDDGLPTTAPQCGSGSKRAIPLVFCPKKESTRITLPASLQQPQLGHDLGTFYPPYICLLYSYLQSCCQNATSPRVTSSPK